MTYKRLEIYLWWTCNHKCIFCVEFPTMEKMWSVKVTHKELLKKLIKYKKKGYNHVTYLWWEPFIQSNFDFALKVWKKLWYTILVTTNANTIQFDNIAKKYLPYIDQLIISIPIIDKKTQPVINNTKVIIDFDRVFENINKYWRWNFLKVNTVINKLNLEHLEGIIHFLNSYWVKSISLTYPDIYRSYYSKDHIISKMAMPYKQAMKYVIPAFELGRSFGIDVKLVDFPFCTFPSLEYTQHTDDFSYQERLKVNYEEKEYFRVSTGVWKNEKNLNIKRPDSIPRMRSLIWKCKKCSVNQVCWWPSDHYKELFWTSDIQPVL